MARDHDTRPLSGEMMTPGNSAGPVLDAEFISLPVGKAGDGPRVFFDPPPAAVTAGMDILHKPAGDGPLGAGPLFWIVGTMVVLCSFWISGGHALLVLLQPAGSG